jgi:hypothetical protein
MGRGGLAVSHRRRFFTILSRSAVEKAEAVVPASTGSHLYEHPYYWPAFILIGDPGDLSLEPAAPRSARWAIPVLIGGCLAVGVLLAVTVARSRRRRSVKKLF